MNDGKTRCLAFCIAEIPATTLDLLLEYTKEYLVEYVSPTSQASDGIIIIDNKDITTITEGSSPRITSPPSAFLGQTLEEVREWFDANITQPRPEGFMLNCFLVLDDESAEDESCLFVCTQDSAPGEIHSLRCAFDVAMQNAVACDVQGEPIEESVLGSFMRSGITMTKENLKLVENGGMYIEDGEVKVDEEWRDFIIKW